MDKIFYFWCTCLFKVCVTAGTTVNPFHVEPFRIPSCERNGIFIRVNELEPVGHVVYKLNCTDEDGDKLNYVIEDGNKYDKFLINQTGHVKLEKMLNADYSPNYHLQISVTEETEKRFSTSVTLAISTINVNDNSPVIDSLPSDLYLHENTSIGEIIASCKISDKDKDTKSTPAGQTSVNLSNNDVATVDSSTCDIYLSTELNYEVRTVYNIEVIARDLDPVAPRSVSQLMKINVLDVNDNSPECEESYILKIREDQTVDTSIVKIQCSDADSGNNSILFYKISEDTNEKAKTTFKVNTLGELYLLQQLDYETQHLYDVRIDVYDGGTPSLTTSVLVSVVVSDVDDNIPTWPNSIRQESVNETLSVGTIVFVMTATDQDDSNSWTSKITYERESITRDWFDIIPNTGVVKVTSPLDWTFAHYVIMNISAHSSDRVSAKSFTTVNITIIDFNNRAPVFTTDNYNVLVKEGTPIGTAISRVKAFDPERGDNGRFSYGIEENKRITVNASSGVISVQQPLNYSTEGEAKIFQLTATDFGVPALTGDSKLLLVVLPFDSKIQELNERLIDAHVDELCMDGNVTLGICVDDNTACDVESLGQKGYCRCSRGLVRSKQDRVVRCQEPPKRIFEETVRTVYVDALTQIDIAYNIHKKYTIADLKLTFYPDSNGLNPRFANSSIIFDLSEANLYTSRRFIMRMTARIDDIVIADSMLIELIKQANTTVEHKDVLENVTLATVVYNLNDNYKNYELDNCSSKFAVRNDKQIVTKGQLDRETSHIHVCSVKGYPNDNISCILEEVLKIYINVIDVNDNPPAFVSSSYVGEIAENKPIDTIVTLNHPISSTDPDVSDNNVTYTIVGGASEFFRLEKVNDPRGVNITSTEVLNREDISVHYLSLSASDGVNSSPVVNVTINVLDVNEPPKFTKPRYNFFVNEYSNNKLVGSVSAEDKDLPENNYTNYVIKSGTFGRFTIDPQNGSIFMQGDIGSKNNASYDFIVYATFIDNTAEVSVTVNDTNEPPKFEKSFVFAVDEHFGEVNDSTCKKIGTVAANDPDFGSFASLEYSVAEINPMGNFCFSCCNETRGSEDGALFIKGDLDYEKTKLLEVVVKAVDGGNKSATTTVTVSVLDLNDNKPNTTKEFYYVTISRHNLMVKDKPVMIIGASDSDSGENGKLSYRITKNEDFLFGISDVPRGVITVNSTKNHPINQTFLLEVEISDNGNPPMSTTVSVNITVKNFQNSLSFRRPELTFTLTERNYTNFVLIENLTSYLNNSKDKQLSFKLEAQFQGIYLSGNENATLRLNKMIDREVKDHYTALVRVLEGNNKDASDIMALSFFVNDTNDNPPLFFQSKIASTSIEENAENFSNVIFVNVTDADLDNVFEYSILNDTVPFIFDEYGWLKVFGDIDTERVSVYEIMIKVSDGVNEANTSIMIVIDDINDNVPTISTTAIDVSENRLINEKVSSDVYFVDADADAPSTPWELGITNEDCPITINKREDRNVSTEVEILLVERLDYEKKKQHVCNISIKDGEEYSSQTLTVNVLDENDNAPRIINFTERVVNLTVLDAKGTVIIGSISATDDDSGENREIVFSLRDSKKDPFDKFAINETTGQVTVEDSLLSVLETEYEMVIVASDRGVPPLQATVTCKLNFRKSTSLTFYPIERLEVNENEVNVSLRTLQIRKQGDFCSECTFYLDDEYVDINKISGLLSVKKEFDYENFTEYSFYVRAEDGDVPRNSAQMKITIDIKDVNEYNHTCATNSFDNSEEDHILGVINVTDKDVKPVYTYEVTNGTCNNSISVDRKSGLTTITSSPVTKENCTMEVKVSEGVYSDTCLVEMVIYRENAYAPEFTKSSYEATLSVEAQKGESIVIFDFKAIDSDDDNVIYGFPENDEHFNIDPNTGTLTLKSDLDVEPTVAVITKTIIAVDGAKKPKTGTTTVEILLTGRVCLREDVYTNQNETSKLYLILFYVILASLCIFIVLFVLACFKWQTLKRRKKLTDQYLDNNQYQSRYEQPKDSEDNIFSNLAPYLPPPPDRGFPNSAVHWNHTYNDMGSRPNGMDINASKL